MRAWYGVGGSDLPAGVSVRVELYWATGPTAGDRVGGPVFAATAARRVGDRSILVPASRLAARPAGATHLVLVIWAGNALVESRTDNNVLSLAL